MARVVLTGMRFHGYHGVFEEEARLGAPFIVDLEIEADLPATDDLARTIDYARVYELVRRVVTGERYRLIEALAHRLARDILDAEHLARAVTVRVHKPHAPLPGAVGDVMVEIHRRREGARLGGDGDRSG
jgi:7,8-dihydroneopterin aldolase/epimerase/oxygenase